MDYEGLVYSFPLDRPLTEQERKDHLSQKEKSLSRPHYQGSVIKMNSTFLECVDKYFAAHGVPTAVIGGMCSMLSIMLLAMTYVAFADWNNALPPIRNKAFLTLLFLYILFIPIFFLVWKYIISREMFSYTHYPIRFNRKTRMVHVFRKDGTIMSEPWDKLYFTLDRLKDRAWEVRGHRLAEDGVTVVETFALPFQGYKDADAANPLMWSQWEFVRRYMESTPEELKQLANQVELVMEVADRRELFWNGFQRFAVSMGIGWILLAPFVFLVAVGRWIANHTSKIPTWTPEIEAESQYDPNDPNIRDAEHVAAPVPVVVYDDEEETDFRK